ncbi:MAG: Chemotaxis protein cheV [Candidatus Magnetoglobus multicellularis str. Araruama]|uniref:Chemotaxis protein cheV n=1 Tax=Candidatus Magnetoglobus multicellularis str. Araruama TaxID=890399 RepID=A0A1V1PIF2_9BACT|nr:MAG: Chemotaxis protein cheV [Candidatus Magnetoglobus multicellularis str. Araruama]
MADKKEILLESGTNELEIAEFILGKQSFGINVAKIREFVPYDTKSVTKVPNSPPSMVGVLLLRGRTIPLINLSIHLGLNSEDRSDKPVVLVTEFNTLVNGFIIDAINQIHRLSWSDIKSLNPVLQQHTTRFTGTVNVKDKEILIMDLEYIVSEIFPEKMRGLTHLSTKTLSDEEIEQRRPARQIVIAEDSNMIRNMIIKTIKSAGYTNIQSFDNGGSAYDYVKQTKEKAEQQGQKLTDYVSLTVSDIEMPRMDGLTFCRNIREELREASLPVIIFSSLINEQMIVKCRSVGANAHVTKPQIAMLVDLMDGLIFGKESSQNDFTIAK